jgi:hypothetical protein
MIKVLLVLDVNHVQEQSKKEKISEPEDGGGKIPVKKNADCILRRHAINRMPTNFESHANKFENACQQIWNRMYIKLSQYHKFNAMQIN